MAASQQASEAAVNHSVGFRALQMAPKPPSSQPPLTPTAPMSAAAAHSLMAGHSDPSGSAASQQLPHHVAFGSGGPHAMAAAGMQPFPPAHVEAYHMRNWGQMPPGGMAAAPNGGSNPWNAAAQGWHYPPAAAAAAAMWPQQMPDGAPGMGSVGSPSFAPDSMGQMDHSNNSTATPGFIPAGANQHGFPRPSAYNLGAAAAATMHAAAFGGNPPGMGPGFAGPWQPDQKTSMMQQLAALYYNFPGERNKSARRLFARMFDNLT